ncbi:hypothetical protein DCCM_2376 [Desulfocucumis palustris]|uniref:Uncharacterized protein n=1 Tax=Desulfocucumis palustris TaxID=1898651 RepID=A0A2L2XAH5_9FIRM|nr:hypothetical protein DCCM_2376 [Desulfocucumis palustris]
MACYQLSRVRLIYILLSMRRPHLLWEAKKNRHNAGVAALPV